MASTKKECTRRLRLPRSHTPTLAMLNILCFLVLSALLLSDALPLAGAR